MVDSPPLSADARQLHSVFLVDDHELVREGLSKVIQSESDLRVSGNADTVTSAFDAIAQTRPEVVIVDISLKGESGIDLIKRLKSLPQPPLMLVVSMHEEPIYAQRALKAGAFGYLVKRESSRKVIEAIRELLCGRMYVSEGIRGGLMQKLVGAGDSPVDGLSDRELDIFRRIGLGHASAKIANDLHISLNTVQTHCANIKRKLGVDNATALLREAVRWVEDAHP